MRYYLTQVRRVTRVTPHMARVAFGCDELADFEWDGPDQRAKLFLPPAGHEKPLSPEPLGEGWYQRFRELPDDIRPTLRTYTVRGYNPSANEIEIDFVLHGDSGPASAWAGRVRPGDYAGILGPYADYDPVPDSDWQLIIGDETALPAIGGILESVPHGTRVHAFVEVADAAEEQVFASKGDVALTWIHRDGVEPGQCGKLAEAIRGAELPSTKPYVWLAAESGSVRTIRRHLVNERGIDRAAIYFSGYWKHGHREGGIPVGADD